MCSSLLCSPLTTLCRRQIRAAPISRTRSPSCGVGTDIRLRTRPLPQLPFSGAGGRLDRRAGAARGADEPVYDYLVDRLTDTERLAALGAALDRLRQDFGHWDIAWGDINRFQRLTDDIVQPFDDGKPSLPVGFAPSQWRALASFASTKPRKTKNLYGATGNIFIAAVDFGPAIRAKALMSGGESGDPSSPHFTDQALMFSQGRFRDVLFYPDEVRAHAERSYQP